MIRPSRRAAVVLNARFLGQPPAGVHRFGRELLRRLPRRLQSEGLSVAVAAPDDVAATALAEVVDASVQVSFGPGRGQLWEQAVLPLFGETVVNLTNSGQIHGVRRQVTVLHDAAVWDFPESYSRRYVEWHRLMQRRLARNGAEIVTVSEFSAQRLSARLRLERAPVIVGNAADHMDDLLPSAPAGLPQQGAIVVVGSVVRHKNLEVLGSLPEELLRDVVVVGRKPEGAVFRAVGLPPDVRFTGPIDDGELKWLLMHARALVVPSLYEGFCLPLVEAQRVGCPVVASDRAALPEIAGRSAVFFDPLRRGDLTRALRTMLDGDVGELRTLGFTNAQRFSWDASAARLSSVIQSAAAPSGPSRARRVLR